MTKIPINSGKMWANLKDVFPGGVNSPVRACRSVNMDPVIFKRALGAFVESIDGDQYLDYVGSWGPMILGHAHPEVLSAVQKAIQNGLSFGAPCEEELLLAQLIIDAIQSIEKIRFVSSGTEAAMSAIRLARGYTQREKIIKFEGCYHGHADFLLSKAGSGIATLEIQGTPGVPDSIVTHTLTAPFNDTTSVKKLFEDYPNQIAAIIVEPVAGNMGVILPKPEFLQEIATLAHQHGALVIFDEVITGFRIQYGGVQNLLNVSPDLTILGKIIGGGMPVGAFGGKKEIMDYLAPLGSVYQAGTLSGNPVAMTSGYTTLKILKNTDPYSELNKKRQVLTDGMTHIFYQKGIHVQINAIGSLGSLFFNEHPVHNYSDVLKSDQQHYVQFYQGMRQNQVLFAPSAYEAFFISTAHSLADIEKTLSVLEHIF